MKAELIFNDLSASDAIPSFPTIEQACMKMNQLIEVIKKAFEFGADRNGFRVHERFDQILLADQYPLSKWRNDKSVDRDRRVYWTSLQTKSPFLQATDSCETAEKEITEEFKYQGKKADGLGWAAILDGLSLSIHSADDWGRDKVEILHEWITDAGLIESKRETVLHAATIEHIETHSEWLRKRARVRIESGNDLWRYRAELFPNLMFSVEMKDCLSQYLKNDPLIRAIFKRLNQFNDYCVGWTSGPFDVSTIASNSKIHGESTSTMSQYGQLRIFKFEDDGNIVCELHVWISQDDRIHFKPVEESKRVRIGYVGPHLPTVKYKT